ncbi:MAG: S49 family peptidase [Magnetococcus sp. YQC-5]
MSSGLLLSNFCRSVWAMHPERISVVHAVLHRWTCGLPAEATVMEQVAVDRAQAAARRQDVQLSAGGQIAVLTLYGILTPRGSVLDVSGPGVTNLQEFSTQLRSAVRDLAVAAILIDVDSPGGNVAGVPELAAEIAAANKTKPVVAIANTWAASGAYWLASAAGEFYASPSGEVGSIGVYAIHVDQSKLMEMQGVATTLISAGEFKTEGNPYGPPSTDFIAYQQSQVDSIYGQFVAAVAKGRKVPVATVREGMGQGRMLLAQDAVAQGMVDGIISFNDLVQQMMKKISAAQKTGGGQSSRSGLKAAERQLSLLTT